MSSLHYAPLPPGDGRAHGYAATDPVRRPRNPLEVLIVQFAWVTGRGRTRIICFISVFVHDHPHPLYQEM
jgi:hypothetical protein